MSKPKAVMGLSGGMDSATLLGYLLAKGFEVHAISFHYGSKHGEYEQQAAKDIVEYYNNKGFVVIHSVMNIQYIFDQMESNLLKSGGDIPEGQYDASNMKKTVVPGRNHIFAAIMAGIAESIEAQIIALGIHSGDHHIYPDCRPEFISALDKTVKIQSKEKVGIISPFTNNDKADILNIGYTYTPQVPYHLTRTCYKDQAESCGKCGSCTERLEAFEKIGRVDPIKYEI